MSVQPTYTFREYVDQGCEIDSHKELILQLLEESGFSSVALRYGKAFRHLRSLGHRTEHVVSKNGICLHFCADSLQIVMDGKSYFLKLAQTLSDLYFREVYNAKEKDKSARIQPPDRYLWMYSNGFARKVNPQLGIDGQNSASLRAALKLAYIGRLYLDFVEAHESGKKYPRTNLTVLLQQIIVSDAALQFPKIHYTTRMKSPAQKTRQIEA